MNPRLPIARMVVVLAGLCPVVMPAQTSRLFGDPNSPTTPSVSSDDLVIRKIELKKLPRQPFKVGLVGGTGQPGREAFVALFAVFQSQYALDDTGKIIPAAPWTDTSLATLSVTLRQTCVDGFYLLGSSPANGVVLKLDGAEPPATETKLKILVCQTGEQSWLDPKGATQKSPLYQEVTLPLKEATPRPPARDQFIAALRSGLKFDVLVKENNALAIQTLEW